MRAVVRAGRDGAVVGPPAEVMRPVLVSKRIHVKAIQGPPVLAEGVKGEREKKRRDTRGWPARVPPARALSHPARARC